MARLDGRVAIVTGAGRGIGRSVATLLAGEGAKYGVTVNAISPGAATRMTESVPTDRRRARSASAEDERSPDNVAPIVAYLASERSGWITGRVIHSMVYEVSLYNNPEPVRAIIGTGPWDSSQALGDQVERAFGPILGWKG